MSAAPSRSRFSLPPLGLAAALLLGLAVAEPAVAGELLVGSFQNDSVLRYDATTGAFLGALVSSGSGGLADPEGLTVGPDGDAYVTSYETDSVLRYDATTGAFLGAFVGPGSGGLAGPEHLVFRGDSLYVSSCENDRVLRYDATTGAFLGTFVGAGSGGLDCPWGLVFGPDGHLYVVSFGDEPGSAGAVLRYHGQTGAFLDAFVPFGSGGIDGPEGLTFGPDGNLYVASNNGVLRYSGSTGAFLEVFVPNGSGGLGFPGDVLFGPDGQLYVTNSIPGPTTGNVLRYSPSTGAFLGVFVPSGSGGLMDPTKLLFTGSCAPSPTALCLTGGRFKVEATWRTPQGQTGSAHAIPLTSDSGYFWFFNSANAELFVKVKDACVAPFDRFWFFAAGLTNVRVDIRVTDTNNGEFQTYVNPLNHPFASIQDTDAFATCP